MAPRIVNLGQWRAHILHRLAHQASATGDAVLAELYQELQSFPGDAVAPSQPQTSDAIVVPLRYRTPSGELSFFSTTTVFGTPLDVTVAELAIEAFYPANRETAEVLKRSA
jgi:hypothetical protein